MKKCLALLSILFFSTAYAQNVTLSGYIKDAANGEELINASIVNESFQGTITNIYGFYSLTLPEGKYTFTVSYIGYESIVKTLTLKESQTLDFELKEATNQLAEVEVTAKKLDENLNRAEMSTTQLTAKQIKAIPQFLGEFDVIRSITLLPGVTTVGEGASGFNVRGGKTDQNLILLDQAPVYNSSHIFGFFSVFNGDAVRDLKLYKGGIPAPYGGRLSSVLDVHQKEGNTKEFAGTMGLGLLSSRLMLEGPLVKDKASFMIAGRRSYQDVLLKASPNDDLNSIIANFYDLNAKVNYKFNDKSRLFLSAYYGKDAFGVPGLVKFDWGNLGLTGRWNYLITDKLFLNVSTIYSDYDYAIGFDFPQAKIDNIAFIKNQSNKVAFSWFPNAKHQVNYGAEATVYDFEPFSTTLDYIDSNLVDISIELQNEYAVEPSLYIEDNWKVNNRLTIRGGLRYSTFYNIGARDVVNYTPTANGTVRNDLITDTTSYASMEIIEAFEGLQGLEPRLGINFKATENTAVKASYNRMRQYIHLISNTTSSLPIDTWRPAGRYIDPGTADQIALGWNRNFKDGEWQLSVETYYKSMRDLVDFKNGAQPTGVDNIEVALMTGRGRSYGLEVQLDKKIGQLTGWLAYTYSRSQLQVDLGATPEEWINLGQWYSAAQDKPHDIAVVAAYAWKPNISFSGSFIYQTGKPYTYPEAKSEFEGIIYPFALSRNNSRTPAYHRLDLSMDIAVPNKKDNDLKGSWNIGVYNAYARKNAFSIFFEEELDDNGDPTGQTKATQLSIFATAIPTITYNLDF
ncbi:TonB-dependent receptor [Schleiferiaceae bacterium]|jgi:outer membrane receptor protein involved in Fe transport|nr:TonB-dependent receptor [Schleiferiaceae bacterium]MDA8565140.1 TonB-dependent receptor [Schleiferiaceae bacterium]MDA8765106.1 TonB-dependent receptor [Schleiferiaceae bacterium]MDA9192236.1 TonB-dependent receptor [Schleiferiaceae bacterium]MDC0083137.1 TonB-dependent receptor [Schleiferiaceae bacterium]